jgi:hypothetical protein
LRRYAFNGQTRAGGPPEDAAAALRWAETNSPPVSALADLDMVRTVLDACARKLDGTQAAANYLARRRQVLHNVLKYGVTKGRLTTIPLADPNLNWERPSDMDVDHEVDPRSVGSPRQVEELLAAVSYIGPPPRPPIRGVSSAASSTACSVQKKRARCGSRTATCPPTGGGGSPWR